MSAAGIRAQLVCSEAGFVSLFAAGLTPGWLKAWLQSAGAQSVEVCLLEQDAWKRPSDWFVFLATEAELLRVALHFGRRIQVSDDGTPGLLGVAPFPLDNPRRHAWYFSNSPSPTRVLLLPPGDIAGERQRWLALLNDNQPLMPLYVSVQESSEAPAGAWPLEAGLFATALAPENASSLLNDGGYLPEEWLMQALHRRGLRVRFSESCTAGGMSERLSRQPGSSAVLDAAWVVYSNQAKIHLLGVPPRLIERHGAVSREVVEAMARSGADARHACVAVSGIAGPSGGSEEKPLGSVWIAACLPDGRVQSICHRFPGSRAEVRNRAVAHAFHLLCRMLSGSLPA